MNSTYAIRSVEGPERYKFGTSTNVQERFAQLTTGSPLRLELFGHCHERVISEKEAHELVKADRLHGEWFSGSALVKGLACCIRDGNRMPLETYDRIRTDPYISGFIVRLKSNNRNDLLARALKVINNRIVRDVKAGQIKKLYGPNSKPISTAPAFEPLTLVEIALKIMAGGYDHRAYSEWGSMLARVKNTIREIEMLGMLYD